MKFNIYKCMLLCVSLVVLGCDKGKVSEKKDRQDDSDTKSARKVNEAAASSSDKPRRSPVAGDETVQDQRRRVAADLVKLLGDTKGGLSVIQWQKARNRYWVAGFDEVIPFGKPGAAARIGELFNDQGGRLRLVEQMLNGKFAADASVGEQDAVIAFHLIAMAIAASGGAAIPLMLSGSADNAEITKGDVILFEIISDALVEAKDRAALTEKEASSWRALAQSPKVLYRLIALNGFNHVEPDKNSWLEFYKLYLEEENPDVLERIPSLVLLTGIQQGAELLTSMKTRAGKKPDSVYIQKLDEAIEGLRRK